MKKKRGKKWPIVFLVVFIVPALAIWVFYSLSNRSGAKAWAEMRDYLEEEGETLVRDDLFPAPIPNEVNFFVIPLLNGIGAVESEDQRARLDKVTYLPEEFSERKEVPRRASGHSHGTKLDMIAWEESLREIETLPMPRDKLGARAILFALDEAHGDVFKALAAGLDRPGARMVPNVRQLLEEAETPYAISVSHYNTMTNLTKTLTLRASAAIASGNREKARESLAILFRINEACREEFIIIGQIVAVTQQQLFMAPVWESLEARLWNEEDLQWLIGELEKIETGGGFLASMRSELVANLEALDHMKERRQPIELEDSVDLAWLNQPWYLLPNGFIDQNKVTVAHWHYDFFIKPMKEGGFMAVKEREIDFMSTREHASEVRRYHSLFARRLMPFYSVLGNRVFYMEAVLAQAKAAAALELHFQTRGAYPRSLENLVPEFLEAVPLDPVSGEPVRYLRYVDGGRCRLWCVGWDGVDDGGKRVLDPEEPEKTKFWNEEYTGDWVWSYVP